MHKLKCAPFGRLTQSNTNEENNQEPSRKKNKIYFHSMGFHILFRFVLIYDHLRPAMNIPPRNAIHIAFVLIYWSKKARQSNINYFLFLFIRLCFSLSTFAFCFFSSSSFSSFCFRVFEFAVLKSIPYVD